MKITNSLSISLGYFIWLAAVAALTLFIMADNVAVTIIWVTFGFGLIFMLLPTVLLYGLCFAPLALTWQGKRWPFALPAILLTLLVALLPHYLGTAEVKHLAMLVPQNFKSEIPIKARSLLIEMDETYSEGLTLPNNSCGAACNSLLKSKQLDWVRVIKKNGPTDALAAKFIAGHAEQCSSPGFTATADSSCVFQTADDGTQADLHLKISRTDFHQLEKLNGGVVWDKVTLWLNAIGKDRSGSIVYQQNQLGINVPFAPSSPIAAINQANSSGGFELISTTTNLNTLSMDRIFRDLGFSVNSNALSAENKSANARWEDGLTSEINLQLVAILNNPESKEFNQQQVNVINNWTTYARAQKQWNAELISLASRIVSDRRLKNYTDIDQVFSSNDEVSRALIPAVLDRIENDPAGEERRVYIGIVRWRFPELKPEILYPYAERIRRLATRDDQIHGLFYPSLGRTDINPLSLLLPFDEPITNDMPELRVVGACYAEAKWTSVIVPALKSALIKSGSSKDQEAYRKSLRTALVAHGELNYVLQSLAPDDHEGRTLKMQVENLIRYRRPDCRTF